MTRAGWLVLLAVAAGCSEPTAEPDTTSAESPVASAASVIGTSQSFGVDTTPAPQIEDPLEAILQGDSAAMFRAVELARRDFVADCMDRSGWQLSQQEMFNLAAEPPAATGYVASLLDQIERGALIPASTDTTVDPVRESAAADCIAEAEVELPNPSTEALSILQQVQDDLGLRAESDTRLIEAAAAFDECIEGVGYGQDSTLTPPAELAVAANMIIASYLDGSQDRARVAAELEQLRVVEAQFDECAGALRAVEGRVNNELLGQLIEDDPALLPGIQTAIADDLARYQPYLIQD